MAKFRKRTSSKGKRWVKGQSSSSNPTTQKHREIAKSRFFLQNLGDTGLTKEALQKHNVLSGNAVAERMEEDISSEGGSVSTGLTFKTFASDWSSCSNASFSRFLKNFRGDIDLHKNILAVLAAITEVIKANGGTESTTEYFAALMTTLEGFKIEEDEEDQLVAVLALLGMGIKMVPQSVLQVKFNSASKCFIEILCKYAETENNIILRSCLTCLSVLLRNQDLAVWGLPSTLQIFDSILSFVTHSKPKIRKAAHHAVSVVLRSSKGESENLENESSCHPAATAVAKFCIHLLESTGATGGSSSTLHILSLLKGNLHEFSKQYIKKCCEAILKMMTLGNSLITTSSLQVFYSLFSVRPNPNAVSASLNAQLINALYDYQPSTSDTQTTQAWLLVLQEGFINLAKLDLSISASNLPRIFTICSNLWLTNDSGICQSATLTLKALIDDCVSPAVSSEENAQKFSLTIEKVFNILQNGLRLQFQNVWRSVLRLLNLMYKVCGKYCSSFMLPYLKTLAELRDSDETVYASEIENVIGSAIYSMGPDRVLKVVPLQIILRDSKHEFKRSWLLPVLKSSIHQSTLQCFSEYFLPLATICRNHSLKMKEMKDEVGAITYDHLQVQIWALLPSFCKEPTDVAINFPKLAKALGITLSSRKDLRHSILQALRKLISSCESNEGNKEMISKFAKNYLPILFNIYTTKPEGSDEEGIRHATLTTIEAYLKLTNNQLVTELFSNIMPKLSSKEIDDDNFLKLALLDLLRVLALHLDCESINKLLQFSLSKISTLKNHSEQKKHFRVLEEICSAETPGPLEFKKQNTTSVKNILIQYLSKSAESSRGARIRCFLHLLPYGTTKKELLTIIPEVVSCCKDKNTHCRKSAHILITEIYSKFDELVRKENSDLDQEDTLKMFIEILVAGLAGSDDMVSATLTALSCLVFKFKEMFTVELFQEILGVVNLLVCSKVPKIATAALDFIKVFITIIDKNISGSFISKIIQTLSAMEESSKSKFRRKTRDIYDRLSRKFTISTVIELVPEEDTETLARLKLLRKKNERKKRMKQKEADKRKTEDDDEDEEKDIAPSDFLKSKPKSIEEILAECDSDEEKDLLEDSEETAKTKKKKDKSFVIEEKSGDIVDFTDLSANRKIISAKRSQDLNAAGGRKKSKDLGFKTTPDGKLIIEDESDSDSEGETSDKLSLNKGLEKLDISLSDDESEEEEKVDTSKNLDELLKDKPTRKRKLSSAESADALSDPKMKYQAGGKGIHRPLSAKAGKIASNKQVKPKAFGSEYKSKKAGGDLRKKGKFEPYSYVPLQRTWLNKRKKVKAAGQFKNLVKKAKN